MKFGSIYELTKTSEELLHWYWGIAHEPSEFLRELKEMPTEEAEKKLEELYGLINQLNGAVGAVCAEELT